jgi:hypothetical protein
LELRNFLIALLIFSLFVIAMNNFMRDYASHYTSDLPEDLSNVEFINETKKESEKIHNVLQQTQITGTPLDIGVFFVVGIYNILKFFINDVINIYTFVVSFISDKLLIPSWISGIFLTLLFIFILFEVISSIVKWKV